MSKSSRECVFCGYIESEHRPNGLSLCTAYEPKLRPRVHVLGCDDHEDAGRATSWTYDPMRDYLLLEVPDQDWTVAYLLAVQAGGLVVAEVRVFPTEPVVDADPGEWSREARRVPEGGLKGRRLRQVGVTEHRDHMDEILMAIREAMGDEAFTTYMGERGLSDQQRASLTGASKLSSDRATRLAQIAGLYVAAVNNGEASPVAMVAEQLGMARSSVRDQLHDARRLELLEGSTVGVAGGTLTVKARELLDGVAKERKR
jgi:hypothetical protein